MKFYTSVRIDIRRINTIKEGNTAVGNRVRARVVKEIDTLVRTIASVKDLEAKTGSGGAEIPPVPLVLDFKAVGGARPR